MLAFKAKLIGRAGLVEMLRVCTAETEELLANARDKHPTHWPPRLKSKFVRKMNTHILEVCDLQNLKMPLVELGDLDLLLPRSNTSTFKRASLAMVGAAAFVGRKISLGRFETQSDNESDDEEEKETPSAHSRGIESSPLSLNNTIKRRETINIGSLSPGRKRPLANGNAMFRKALNHSSTQPAARNHGNEVKAGGDAEADTRTKIGDIATDSRVADDDTVALKPDTRLTNKPTEEPEPRNSTETEADLPIVVGPDDVQNSGSRPIQNHVHTPDTVTHTNANTNANSSPHPHPNTHTHTQTDPTHSIPPEPATGTPTPTPMRMHTQCTIPHTPGESQPQLQPQPQTQPLVLPQPQPLVLDPSLSLNEDALLTPATGLGSFSNDSIASARSCPVGDNVECARASALLGDPKFLSVRPHIHRRRGERA
ncbi:hypothetical protein SARC_12627 [Sphaeroforma arctica JP610]|uniref:Uncharacterized protein n=1 Tax=Sphaeroforma arctica JP610 TaxID=667725 RepID=A0A0L0FDI7_9EUKA|nr:hypothetical protein SARC_12627 [Sphaeroforma arctica JP610]KNC74834.1 hypothetical protein SARC_12627 [Sphaeroforma arctica JP610]|eukprot:XP_014148736.1 hypothetical protein SARC_12627 [Sphaeroforma arctica JP610]